MEISDGLSFFPEVVQRVAGEYMKHHGFSPRGASPTRVWFGRDDALVSFAYYMEDLPSPWLAVDVGVADDAGHERKVALWRALEPGDPARQYTQWEFDDAESLEHVLRRVLTEVVDVHGPPLWDGQTRLARLLAEQAEEMQAAYLDASRQADLAKARRSYDQARYQEAIDGFVLVGNEDLTARDRRHLYEARKRLAGASSGDDE